MGITIYILQEMYTTGRYNTMFYTIPTNIPGHDEDLRCRKNSLYKKCKMAFFHRFQQYYSVFIRFITFNWAITTDFKQMKTYLKENYPTEAKSPKHFGRH
jgi:linoleoyl-CoA desaturase